MVNLPDRFVWEITNSLIPSSNLNGSDTMAQQKRRTLPPKNTRRNAEALGIDLDRASKRLFSRPRMPSKTEGSRSIKRTLKIPS